MTQDVSRGPKVLVRLCGLLVALALGAITYLPITAFGVLLAGSEISDQGSAQVQSCTRVGPIGRDFVGWWWECRAQIAWDSGRSEETVVRKSQLAPEDVGHSVAVVERQVDASKYRKRAEVHRADFEPNYPLGYGLTALILLVVLPLFTWSANGLWRLLRRPTGK
ncbi:MAG TPA: DUF6346 domain-containing protein [Pseudonocardiaceae bacterium]|nr:DUF6346 domain-containing protein [Pseudonocardiaceae bacterium]